MMLPFQWLIIHGRAAGKLLSPAGSALRLARGAQQPQFAG
jgi:hypothetical protein